jgi:haloalkane dehalogenase
MEAQTIPDLKALPAWLDRKEYPFQQHWMQIDGNNIHYIDEGTGEPLLMVHGTPDWSFSFRHLIKAFSGKYRCIIMDNLGFGLSEKPADADYRPETQAARLEKFIEKLDLQHIHLLVHDFGGPIGLSYALHQPENIKQIILFNTWMWPLNGIKMYDGSKMMTGAIGRWLYLHYNFSPKVMVKLAYGDKSKLTKHIHNHYIKALDKPAHRMAQFAYVKAMLQSQAFYQSLWDARAKIENTPMLIMWGMKDRFFPADILLNRWKQAFPSAIVKEISHAGHFLQDEAPDDIITEMEKFLD